MKVVEINVKEEYKKKFEAKQKDEYVLDLIFTSGLFPAKLYYPAEVSMGGGYLSVLSSEVWKAFSLKELLFLAVPAFSEMFLVLKNMKYSSNERGLKLSP